MFIKKIKRRCDVKGCKNTDTFCISRSSEIGNSVIICRNCLSEALKAAETYIEPEKAAMSNPPELFFGTAAGITFENETIAEETNTEKAEIDEAVDTGEADEESITQDTDEMSNAENNINEQPSDADLNNEMLGEEKPKNSAKRKPSNRAERKTSVKAAKKDEQGAK